MKFTVLTLFPEIFAGFLDASILGRARRAGQVEVELVALREFATDPAPHVRRLPLWRAALVWYCGPSRWRRLLPA